MESGSLWNVSEFRNKHEHDLTLKAGLCVYEHTCMWVHVIEDIYLEECLA